MKWDAMNTEMLIDLRKRKHLTFGQIAFIMKLSRNAVIGKYNRLNTVKKPSKDLETFRRIQSLRKLNVRTKVISQKLDLTENQINRLVRKYRKLSKRKGGKDKSASANG